jgi:hypothetical protein
VPLVSRLWSRLWARLVPELALVTVTAAASLGGLGCVGCDQGHQDDQPIVNSAVPIVPTLLTTTVQAGDPIVLQFNRFLNPGTVNRQTIELLTSSGTPFTDAVVDYDPVLLTVTLRSPPVTGGASAQGWVVPGQTYQVKVVVATPTTQGLLAIDNATLAAPFAADLNVTGPVTPSTPEPQMHFCVDIAPIFNGKCAGSVCHSSPAGSGDSGTFPAAGLVLDNGQGVLDTAVGQVALESNVGPNAGTYASASCPITDYQTCSFGVQMPVIDPGTGGTGDPANSYLLYKVLLAVPPSSDPSLVPISCGASQTYVTKPTPATISAAERTIMSNYIVGSQMPFPGNASPLTIDELERLRLWIKQGAQLEGVQVYAADGSLVDGGTNCSLCQPLVEGGAPDGGSDAPSDGATDAPKDSTKD